MNKTIAALTVLGVVSSSIWVIAGAINTANAADEKATRALQMVQQIADKIEGLDVINEQLKNNTAYLGALKREIDEVQTKQNTSNAEQSRKLDKIIEKLDQ